MIPFHYVYSTANLKFIVSFSYCFMEHDSVCLFDPHLMSDFIFCDSVSFTFLVHFSSSPGHFNLTVMNFVAKFIRGKMPVPIIVSLSSLLHLIPSCIKKKKENGEEQSIKKECNLPFLVSIPFHQINNLFRFC